MNLGAQQLAQFERDGYLTFPGLFSKGEIAVLRAETDWVVSRNTKPLPIEADEGVLRAA